MTLLVGAHGGVSYLGRNSTKFVRPEKFK